MAKTPLEKLTELTLPEPPIPTPETKPPVELPQLQLPDLGQVISKIPTVPWMPGRSPTVGDVAGAVGDVFRYAPDVLQHVNPDIPIGTEDIWGQPSAFYPTSTGMPEAQAHEAEVSRQKHLEEQETFNSTDPNYQAAISLVRRSLGLEPSGSVQSLATNWAVNAIPVEEFMLPLLKATVVPVVADAFKAATPKAAKVWAYAAEHGSEALDMFKDNLFVKLVKGSSEPVVKDAAQVWVRAPMLNVVDTVAENQVHQMEMKALYEAIPQEARTLLENEIGAVSVPLWDTTNKDLDSLVQHMLRSWGRNTDLLDHVAAIRGVPARVMRSPLAQRWSGIARTIRGLIDPIQGKNVHPVLRVTFQTTGNYTDAQLERIYPMVTAITGLVERSFGVVDALKTNAPVLPTSAWSKLTKKGKIRKNDAHLLPYIGTLFHILQVPDEYTLTPEQKIAVDLYHFAVNEDFRITKDAGVKLPPMVQNWVHHGIKYTPEQLDTVGGIASKVIRDMPTYINLPDWARKRKLTLSAFIKKVDSINKERILAGVNPVEVDTDIEDALFKRLVGGAHLRSATLFAKELEAKMQGSGMLISPHGVINIAGQNFKFAYAPEVKGLHLEDIRAALEPLSVPPDISWVQQLSNDMRAIKLNLDVGVLGRQGMQLLSYSPVLYAKSLAETVQTVTSSPYYWALWMARNKYDLGRASASGLILRANSDLIVQGPTVLGRLSPSIDEMNKLQFERFLPIAKLHMWRQLLQDMKDIRDYPDAKAAADKLPFFRELTARMTPGKLGKEWDDVALEKVAAKIVNKRLGGINWREVGFKQRPSEQFMFLTPGWLRGNIGTMLAAMTDYGAEGMMTRRLIAQDFANQVLWSEGLAALSPDDHVGNLDRYDPRSRHFMSIKWGEGYFGVSPSVRYWKVLAQLVSGGKDAPSEDVVSSRFDELLRFGRSSLNTPVAATMDLLTKQDFFGRPLETKEDYARWGVVIFAPILATILTGAQAREVSPSDTLGQMAANAVGLNSSLPSLTDYRNEAVTKQDPNFFTETQQKWMQQSGKMPIYGAVDGTPDRPDLLESGQKRNIDMLPEIQRQDTLMNAGKQSTINRINDYREHQSSVQFDEELAAGKLSRRQWRDEISTLVRSHGSEMRKMSISQERVGTAPPEEGSYNAALAEYLNIFEKFYAGKASIPEEQQDDLSAALSTYMGTLDESHRDYLFRNLHKNLTEEGKNYYRDLPRISKFLGLRQEVLNDVPVVKQFFEQQVPSWRRSFGEQTTELLMSKSPQFIYLNDQLDVRRKIYLALHPEEAKLVAKWFPDMQSRFQIEARNK